MYIGIIKADGEPCAIGRFKDERTEEECRLHLQRRIDKHNSENNYKSLHTKEQVEYSYELHNTEALPDFEEDKANER